MGTTKGARTGCTSKLPIDLSPNTFFLSLSVSNTLKHTTKMAIRVKCIAPNVKNK